MLRVARTITSSLWPGIYSIKEQRSGPQRAACLGAIWSVQAPPSGKASCLGCREDSPPGMQNPERWWEEGLKMWLLPSPVQMDMPNACCTRSHMASSLPDKRGEEWDACQAKRSYWIFCLFSQMSFLSLIEPLSSFCVRVIGATSVYAELLVACFSRNKLEALRRWNEASFPPPGPHASRRTGGKASELAQNLTADPADFPEGWRIGPWFSGRD